MVIDDVELLVQVAIGEAIHHLFSRRESRRLRRA